MNFINTPKAAKNDLPQSSEIHNVAFTPHDLAYDKAYRFQNHFQSPPHRISSNERAFPLPNIIDKHPPAFRNEDTDLAVLLDANLAFCLHNPDLLKKKYQSIITDNPHRCLVKGAAFSTQQNALFNFTPSSNQTGNNNIVFVPHNKLRPIKEEAVSRLYPHPIAFTTSSTNHLPQSRLLRCVSEKTTNTSHLENSFFPKPPERDAKNEDMREFDSLDLKVSPLPRKKNGICKVMTYSPQAYKFFIEQHIENVIRNCRARARRKAQLEEEMTKVKLFEDAKCQMRKMLSQKESNHIRLKRSKMKPSMFNKIATLGVGAFGEVALVNRKDNPQTLYAMKILRKMDVIKRNQAAHVKAERDILAEADNEWVVKLYYSFQDAHYLYFVMDYIPGGDMMNLLIRFSIFSESLAQFYIAELVLAIESVHKMGFIHRDIKPDNILICKNGHIKLTDFGLCTGFRWTHNSKYYQEEENDADDSFFEGWKNECNCVDKFKADVVNLKHNRCLAHSLVGTPNYIAPEVLLRKGYTQSCDWWSVGVIMYEMLVGRPPFLANSPIQTQIKVTNWRKTLRIPPQSQLSPSAASLILGLCKDYDKRLGLNGSNEIKAQAFFRGVDFATLRHTPSPYVPQIKHPTDISNFDPIDESKEKKCDLKALESGANMNGPQHAFFEFTFRRFFDDSDNPLCSYKNFYASTSGESVLTPKSSVFSDHFYHTDDSQIFV